MAKDPTPIAEALTEARQNEPAPVQTATEITGLETLTEAPKPTPHGTVAEILALRKLDQPKPDEEKDPKKAEETKANQLDELDDKLQDFLFKNKRRTKKKLAPETATEDEPKETKPAEAVTEPEPEKAAPAKAPTKKAVVRDRSAEIRERELALEREKLELERERLELDKSKHRQPESDKPGADLSALSSDERYELEVFHAMAKLDPAKHSNLPNRFIEVANLTSKYKTQWEKDRPGESFDPDDSDHDEFFAKHQVRYDKKEFRRAELKLASEGESDPKLEKIEKSQAQILAKDKLRELEPVITDTWAKHAKAMVEAIDPEILKAFDNGGKDKMLELYPDEGVEVMRAGEALSVVATEAYKLLDGDGLFAPESGNRIHERILDTVRKQERIIPAQPKENRLDADGRDFATWAQWAEMSPQQQDNYWHMDAEAVVDIFSRDLAARVKYEIGQLNKRVDARLKRKTDAPKGGTEPAAVKEKTQEHRSPSASPGAASKTTVDVSAKPSEPADDKFQKIIRSALFKRPS